MHETECVVVVTTQPKGQAHLVSVIETLLKKSLIHGSVVKGEHPHGDAPNLGMAVPDERSVMGIDRYQIAFLDGVVGSGDGTREHPWMESLQ